MKMKSGYFWSLWKDNPWSRVYFMFLFLIPIPLLIVSITLFYRLPCINKATEEIENSLQVRYEVEREKIATSDKEMKFAMNNWEGVRKKIPHSYEAVSNLIIDLNRFVSSRGFEMSYTLGELKPAYNREVVLSLLPINLKLSVSGIDANQTKSVPTGTIQFVRLLHEIVNSYYGVDLAGVVVTGIGDGIKVIDVSINLWVGFGSEPYINKEV